MDAGDAFEGTVGQPRDVRLGRVGAEISETLDSADFFYFSRHGYNSSLLCPRILSWGRARVDGSISTRHSPSYPRARGERQPSLIAGGISGFCRA